MLDTLLHWKSLIAEWSPQFKDDFTGKYGVIEDIDGDLYTVGIGSGVNELFLEFRKEELEKL